MTQSPPIRNLKKLVVCLRWPGMAWATRKWGGDEEQEWSRVRTFTVDQPWRHRSGPRQDEEEATLACRGCLGRRNNQEVPTLHSEARPLTLPRVKLEEERRQQIHPAPYALLEKPPYFWKCWYAVSGTLINICAELVWAEANSLPSHMASWGSHHSLKHWVMLF